MQSTDIDDSSMCYCSNLYLQRKKINYLFIVGIYFFVEIFNILNTL